MDGRGNLVPLVSAAFDARELPALVAPWAQLSASAAEAHGKRAVAEPGSELVWRHHQSLAVATTQLLESIVHGGSAADDDEEIVMRVAGSGAHRAIDILRNQGFDAEIVGE
jgi:triacylglycerol esterase/lipase EstA (alpha/beta hydrolase family)